jgi:hypothetical protein
MKLDNKKPLKKYRVKKHSMKRIFHNFREYYLAEDAEVQISEYASVSIMLLRDVKRLSKAIKKLSHIKDRYCLCPACKASIKLGFKKPKIRRIKLKNKSKK